MLKNVLGSTHVVVQLSYTGVPERIEISFTGKAKGENFQGTYNKVGWEAFGFPVYINVQDGGTFYRNLQGFWCFTWNECVHETKCDTKVAVKTGKFPFLPPESGWTYEYDTNDFRSEPHMKVISHW